MAETPILLAHIEDTIQGHCKTAFGPSREVRITPTVAGQEYRLARLAAVDCSHDRNDTIVGRRRLSRSC